MKKHYLLSLLLASFLLVLAVHGVHAQGSPSVSGDELCGAASSTECNLSHLKIIFQRLLVTLTTVGVAAIVIFAIFRLLQAEVAARQGNPAARFQALRNIVNGLVGIILVLAVAGGFYLLFLQLFGANSWATGFLQLLSSAFVEHAYAADTRLLPNPLGAYNFFDLLLAGLNLIVKFFIYPTIVALWVWAGFQFVYSQGNPEGLKKAKSWLLWSFIITVVMFTLQGFVLALRATMLNIAPQNAAIQQSAPAADVTAPAQPAGNQVVTDPLAPTDGAPGSACTTASGSYGIRGTDGSCTSRSDSYQPVTNCTGYAPGTACTVAGRAGTCTYSTETSIFSCYVTPSQ